MPAETELLPRRYRDLRRIGSGGMGDIYRAEDSVLDRTVAVKVLAERYAGDDSVRRRFTREALTAARLSSAPNTVTIFDVGETDGRPFIVMELLPGGSLEDRLRREGAQPPGQALAWLDGAAGALDAAHAAGVVHRDVKPANLLLDATGEVHVADFGIASAAGLDSLTHPGTILGTAGYLSPEQARGEPAGPAADRYSFAVVAFELLTGRRPFAHEQPTAEAAAHVSEPVPDASSLRPELPPAVDAVLRRALAKHPSDRYGSCAELVLALREAFDAAAGATEVRAAPVPLPAHATPRPGRAPARTASARPVGRPPRGRPPVIVPLALLALLLAGLAGVALASLLGNGDETAPAPGETVVTTVQETLPGTTLRETVTQEVPATPPPAEPPAQEDPATPAGGDAATGAQLNDRGFARMQQGDYAGALPLLEQAVRDLSGSGQLAEAYALYNLAYTRLQLGSCEGVTEMLDRSQAIQGRRSEIDSARAEAAERC